MHGKHPVNKDQFTVLFGQLFAERSHIDDGCRPHDAGLKQHRGGSLGKLRDRGPVFGVQRGEFPQALRPEIVAEFE